MPHMVIEYDQRLEGKLDMHRWLARAHQFVCEYPLFNPAAVKSRAYPFYLGFDGDGSHETLNIHIRIAILGGRTTEQKRVFSQAGLAHFSEGLPVDTQLSVEVHDLDPETYCKVTIKA